MATLERADEQNHALAGITLGDDPGQPASPHLGREPPIWRAAAQRRLCEFGEERAEVLGVGGCAVRQLAHHPAVEVTAGRDCLRIRQPGRKQVNGDRLEPPKDVVDDLVRRRKRRRDAAAKDDGGADGQRIETDRKLFLGWSGEPDDPAGRDVRQRQRFPACH
jgi:hypothetical protein